MKNWATANGYTGSTATIIARRIRHAERTGASKATILANNAGSGQVDRALRDWAKGNR